MANFQYYRKQRCCQDSTNKLVMDGLGIFLYFITNKIKKKKKKKGLEKDKVLERRGYINTVWSLSTLNTHVKSNDALHYRYCNFVILYQYSNYWSLSISVGEFDQIIPTILLFSNFSNLIWTSFEFPFIFFRLAYAEKCIISWYYELKF